MKRRITCVKARISASITASDNRANDQRPKSPCMSDRSTKSEYRDVRAPRGKHHWVVIAANRRSSAVLSDLRSLFNGAWHAPSELTRAQAVRPFVAVVRLSLKLGRRTSA